jgi:RNA polymerase sigma factor (sigma-70 family)
MMRDSELLAEFVSSGSQEAFADIVQRHTNMVYAACLRILGDVHMAEDATQTTFLVLARKAHKLTRKTVLAGWLFRTAGYTALNARTMEGRRKRHESEAAGMAEETSPEDGAWEEIRPVLDGAVASLPRVQRDTVVLRYLEGMSRKEIAREMNCSEFTVRTRLTRALAKLRTNLGRKAVVVSEVLLATFLAERVLEAAPVGLAASVGAVCEGTAAASASVSGMAGKVIKVMFWAKAKVCATVTAAVATALVGGAVVTARLLPAGAGADEEPVTAPRAETAPMTVKVGAGAVGSTIRYIGATTSIGPRDDLIRGAHVNVTQCWRSLARIEKALLPGDVRGRPTKQEVLEKGPEKAFDWDKLEPSYSSPGDEIRRCRDLGLEVVPNIFPKYDKDGKSGRWSGPGCPTTEEDWHEWWRGCFVMAYVYNVREKLGVRHWELGSAPDWEAGMGWKRRDGRFGTVTDMARLVAVGADAIRTACKYANVEPVIGGVGEFREGMHISWWDGIVRDERGNSSLDAFSFFSHRLNRHTARVAEFNKFISFSRAHPHPETGESRRLWDTGWTAREAGPGRICDTRDLGYALMLMGKIIDQNETGFFDMSVVFRMHDDAPDHGVKPGAAVQCLILKSDGPDGKKIHTPTVSYYALRMACRALAGGKERLAVSGMPTTVEKGPGVPYESYEEGEECFLCTASRDGESVFVTFLNATAVPRTMGLDLSELNLEDKSYIVRELSREKSDEEVAASTLDGGPLEVTVRAASALQIEVKR